MEEGRRDKKRRRREREEGIGKRIKRWMKRKRMIRMKLLGEETQTKNEEKRGGTKGGRGRKKGERGEVKERECRVKGEYGNRIRRKEKGEKRRMRRWDTYENGVT